MGVSVTDRGFKRNLTQLTGRYDSILVHLYVLLNHASITEPSSAICAMMKEGVQPLWLCLEHEHEMSELITPFSDY